MSLLDIFKAILSAIGLPTPTEVPQPDGQGALGQPYRSPPAASDVPPKAIDQTGTFLLPDIFPPDLGSTPPFSRLVGLKIGDKQVVGCCVKASEGLGWGSTNEDWFRRSWKQIREVGGSRYGDDWFRCCYHFLRFSVDGARQADYLCDLVESAGGWGPGDLMPWVDIEEGGQGNWAPGPLETLDPATKHRLATSVAGCTTSFIKQFKVRTGGLRIAMYGRGIFRDLGMSSCLFGADGVVNPAYTARMPPMDAYGAPLSKISWWQACGDGEIHVPGYPRIIPGWGATDYSIYINGPEATTLSSLRRRCLARP